MKKVISFSLWGDSIGYLVGGIINADRAEKYWQDWTCRFYISPDVPTCFIEELAKRKNVEIIIMPKPESWNGMFWRFYPCSDPEVDVMISRDSDSWLNIRDKAAVDEWLESDKDFHIIRDCCQHGWHICGGLWGARNGILSNMTTMINEFGAKETYNRHGIDQMFLKDIVYPIVQPDAYVHDDWFDGFPGEVKHPLPIPRLRGKGWDKQEFPKWHCGHEDDKDRFPIGIIDEDIYYDKEKKEYKPMPCCGVYHDNEYIGKQERVWGRYARRYADVIECINQDIARRSK